MDYWKPKILRAALDALYFGQIHRLLGRATKGVGAILTLHHVGESKAKDAFAPNRILDITPAFLEQAILKIRRLGYQFVTLDEVRRRLIEQDFSEKFVSLTLDDGYLDNLTNAAPLLRRLEVPFTVYVATGMPDGQAVLWWVHLEDIIRDNDHVQLSVDAEEFRLPTRSTREKYLAFNSIYWAFRAASHESRQTAIERMLERFGVDPTELCRRSAMSWADLSALGRFENATIGAHTVNHYIMSGLTEDKVRREAEESRARLTEKLDTEPAHFCYPYGDANSAGPCEFEMVEELGFATATTVRKGVLFPEHKHHLFALPRISLNGDYQRTRYLELFMSGAPFALMNRFRRLDVGP